MYVYVVRAILQDGGHAPSFVLSARNPVRVTCESFSSEVFVAILAFSSPARQLLC